MKVKKLKIKSKLRVMVGRSQLVKELASYNLVVDDDLLLLVGVGWRRRVHPFGIDIEEEVRLEMVV